MKAWKILLFSTLLLVLGSWASGRGLGRLLPAEAGAHRPKSFRLSLERRRDFAQHFLTSAAALDFPRQTHSPCSVRPRSRASSAVS